MDRTPLEKEPPLQASWPTEPAGEPPRPESRMSFFKELPVLIVIAFGLALLIKTFLVQAFFIPSESMLPTLEVGDRVLVNKLAYRFREARRGEVIVFAAEKDTRPRSFMQKVRDLFTEGLGVRQPRERDFIKRVIGLPGDDLSIRKGRVTIKPSGAEKGFRLTEPYIARDLDVRDFGPITVPDDSYFVMGDNRPNSSDSRFGLGSIKREDIVGKAFVRIWPLSRAGLLGSASYESEPRPNPQPASALHVLSVVAVAAGVRRRAA